MRLGLFFSDVGEPNDILRSIVDAERDGFDGAWLSQIFGNESLMLIAQAGRETQHIEFGTAVVPVYSRHPFTFAQQVATTASMTSDRFALGIGLSHQPVVEGMWGLSYQKPARYMREYLQVLRPLLDDGKVSFQGEVFRVAGAIQSPQKKPVPVLIAALSPVMLRIAGELADGTVTWMTGIKTIGEHTVPSLRAATEAADRSSSRIVVALPTAVTDDPKAARQRVAQGFAVYGQLPNYRRMLDREGVEGPSGVAVVGNEAQVEDQIRAFAAAGTTDYVATMIPVGDNAAKSLARTRDLLKGLVGGV
jgi:F420-dependent oxidoreductase-like protein